MSFNYNTILSVTMDFDKVIRKRKMIREYNLERQIPNEKLQN
jgi:hypothetical protein